MKRLTEAETAVVKHFNITPENIGMVDNFSEIATWCMQNGYAEVYDKISAANMIERIEDIFWASDGFDVMSIEDVAAWVLITYVPEEFPYWSSDEIINYLQKWKYYFGFRKMEGWGEVYRHDAFDVLDGVMVQDPNSEDICYVDL